MGCGESPSSILGGHGRQQALAKVSEGLTSSMGWGCCPSWG